MHQSQTVETKRINKIISCTPTYPSNLQKKKFEISPFCSVAFVITHTHAHTWKKKLKQQFFAQLVAWLSELRLRSIILKFYLVCLLQLTVWDTLRPVAFNHQVVLHPKGPDRFQMFLDPNEGPKGASKNSTSAEHSCERSLCIFRRVSKSSRLVKGFRFVLLLLYIFKAKHMLGRETAGVCCVAEFWVEKHFKNSSAAEDQNTGVKNHQPLHPPSVWMSLFCLSPRCSGGSDGAGHHESSVSAGEADCHHCPREDALVSR